jgi:hypothetical protein
VDIFSLLRQDQDEAERMLAEWARHPEGPQGAELWARWSERWEVHARIEENFLFPRLKDDPTLRRRLGDVSEAHAAIRQRMQEMPPCDDRDWARAVSGLLRSLENLAEMEERRLFPRARAALSREEAEDLAQEVLDFLQGLRTAMAAGP